MTFPIPPNADGDLAAAFPHVADRIAPRSQDVLGKLASMLVERPTKAATEVAA